ncbi:hypothetical protein, partial [Ethanoligenens sp.]|uniref:hypothetical protein n=1 Tax=Ethanoligenens sp. TaxID=2099655 RepID=UPI0039EA0C67
MKAKYKNAVPYAKAGDGIGEHTNRNNWKKHSNPRAGRKTTKNRKGKWKPNPNTKKEICPNRGEISMNSVLLNAMAEKKILSLYTDTSETNKFTVGYILGTSDDYVLLNSIATNGIND